MRHERPQRLTPAAPPGALLKRLDGLRKIAREQKTEGERDEAYLALIRQLPCLRCGMEPCGEAAHVRLSSAAFHKRGGMSKKPADRWTVPLDRGCHQTDHDALHRIGEYLFWQQLNINPLLIADRLWKARGDLVAMRAIVMLSFVERGR